MTNQEAFDKMVAHLRKQNAQSIDNGKCMYRGPNGLMCAVGCLIPDDKYSPAMENLTPQNMDVRNTLPRGISLSLLLDMQLVHDTDKISDWEGAFKHVAETNHVTYTPPN